MSLILNISANNVRSYCITYGPDKISVAPEFPGPQLFPQFRKLFKYFSGRYAFHYLHHLGRRISRRNLDKYVYMIIHYLHRIYCEPVLISYLSKYLFNISSNFTTQYTLSVLRYPYQMVFQVIYCMLSPSYHHITVISSSPLLKQMSCFRRFTATHFPPTSKLAGIQWSFL